MSKAILIPANPFQCLNIESKKQSIIVTKTKPKLKLPYKEYIYCTNRRPYLVYGDVFRGNWETEFTALSGYSREKAEKIWDVFNGNVIGEFWCDTIITDKTFGHDALFNKAACMTDAEVAAYCVNNEMYGFHISNLEIYDCPKSLSVFKKPCDKNCSKCDYLDTQEIGAYENTREIKTCLNIITKAPSSWCYVEELK